MLKAVLSNYLAEVDLDLDHEDSETKLLTVPRNRNRRWQEPYSECSLT